MLPETGQTSAQLVRTATRLAPVPFVPEVRLHQSGDIYAMWELTERESGQTRLAPPFWSVAWPGGQALARYLLDHPGVVAGRSVLDVGSGSGLVAISAARAGAGVVVASETDPLASAAIEINAAANNLPAPARVGSVIDSAGTAGVVQADVVLAGDVWYERELAVQVAAYLESAAAAGAHVLTGDIGRSYFPRDRYRHVASYELPASFALEGRERLSASVWQVDPPDAAQISPLPRAGRTARKMVA